MKRQFKGIDQKNIILELGPNVRGTCLFVMAATFFASLIGIPTLTAGQVLPVSKLPEAPGVYIWTKEAPRLFERIDELLISPLHEHTTDDRSTDEFKETDDRIVMAKEIWRNLFTGEVFNGDAVLFIECTNDDEPTFSNLVFLAETDATEERVRELIAKLQYVTISESRRFDEETFGKELQNKASFSYGNWKMGAGWFVWGTSKAKMDVYFDAITDSTTREKQLGRNLTFQRAIQKVGANRANDGSCSFFVSSNALRLMFPAFATQFVWFKNLSFNQEQWVNSYLNEISSLSGVLTISQAKERENESHEIPLMLDAYLLLTAPKHGVLSAITGIDVDHFDLSPPTLRESIAAFSQWHLDGEKFDDERNRWRNASETDSAAQLQRPSTLRFTEYLSQVTYMREGFLRHGFIESNTTTYLAKASDIDEFEQGKLAMLPEVARYDESEMDGHYPSDVRGSLRLYGPSKQTLEKQREKAHITIRELNAQIRELKRTTKPLSPEQQAELEHLESSIVVAERLEQYYSSRPIDFAALGGWIIQNFSKQQLENLTSHLGEQHDQFAALTTELKEMQKLFNHQLPLCGVHAYWGEGLKAGWVTRSQPIVFPKPDDTDQELDESQGQQLRPRELANNIAGDIDRLVAAAFEDETGFRLNVIISTKPQE